MSSSPEAPSSSTPNFQPIFKRAQEEYKKKSGKGLSDHPLAAEIDGCGSPETILKILEGKANELKQSLSGDERLTKWLNPTVTILNALSSTLGEGVGSVFPPTKIIFSGIGILLVAAKDTAANSGVLVQLFERIESFFERIKIYTTEVPTSPALTGKLANIMAEVLTILGIATKGIKERRLKTFLKKAVGMNDDIKDALQRFDELERQELLTAIAQVLTNTTVLKGVAKGTTPTLQEVMKKMDACNWEDVLRKLKEWLYPLDTSKNYNIGLLHLHMETTTWFLESRIFQEWHSNGSLLWIHGKPGSGKSVLCSAIIQRIRSLCDGGSASVVYFYFDFRDEKKKHRHDLLLSLLVQLSVHSIPCCDMLSRVYPTHGKGTQQPSDDILINCLIDVLSTTTKHLNYIIVDAIDESPDTSGEGSPRRRVLSLIKSLVDLHLPNLRICTTSRPETDIRTYLEPLTSLRISLQDQTGHKEDIANYIRSEVDFIAGAKRWQGGDKDLVIETLSNMADGMFRWVFCQLEMLRCCFPSKVRQSLKRLPKTLDETYKRILEEIPETNQDHVQRLLQCVAVAIRPLRVEELAETLALDWDVTEGEVPKLNVEWQPGSSEDQEQELLSACPSLITIVDSGDSRVGDSRVVQFSHFSVKEFLTSDRLSTSSKDISRYYIHPEAAHMTITRASLGVLLSLDDLVNRRYAMSTPLAAYAAEYWVSHARVGSITSHVMDTMKTLFDPDKPHFTAWVQIYDIDRPRWDRARKDLNVEPLYYSVLCGFYDLVEHLVKNHSQHVNTFGGEHDYPLVAALQGEYIRVADLLLQHGANVDFQGTYSDGKLWTPLHSAAALPNDLVAVSAAQFLLEHGASVNTRDWQPSGTPLHVAVQMENFELVRILLQHGAEVDSLDSRGHTPLRSMDISSDPVTEGSRVNTCQVLLEYGADVNYPHTWGGSTLLHDASLLQQLDVVRTLLNHGADVNAEGDIGRTPLHRGLKLYESRFGIPQLLVKHGADVNARDKHHETPLHVACFNYPETELVQFLLDNGVNVNIEDNWGRTPLHRVFRNDGGCLEEKRLGVAQLLVDHMVDMNVGEKRHETPLHLASYTLESEFVSMLLDNGANVDAEDNRGRTPLHGILEYNRFHSGAPDRFSVARLLVERGANVNTRDKDCQTPLHMPFYLPDLKLVQMLLGRGANVHAEDNWGRTPLHQVLGAEDYSDKDHSGVYFHGGDAYYSDDSEDYGYYRDDYSLMSSSYSDKGRFAIAQLLVEHGADVNAQDVDHETPLHLASRLVSLGVAWLLLKHGADINMKNKQGKTPFQLARESMEEEMEQSPSKYSLRRAQRAQGIALMGLLYG